MRVGRIPYINCYPVYGAIDRGVVRLDAELVDGIPSALNRRMAEGSLDISVISAVEYARDAARYLLLPDLAISCDGPVRSVMLFSRVPAAALGGRRVLVTRSSMTSVVLLELLFEHVWGARPVFIPADAEIADLTRAEQPEHDARLIIGDAALLLSSGASELAHSYPYAYDLGQEWKDWTGLPFVFAVWVALRSAPVEQALALHAQLIRSRDWGLAHLGELAEQASSATGVSSGAALQYLSGLDYGLRYEHLAGLTTFFGKLAASGRVPNGSLVFLPAA
ncbi:MAG TPA: menaquinone biosynthesis protein [Gemmatimonadaceae bacterium]|jgi:chorismate dehydratase|nr:menaquinone biosynthesis protein [Gemmatimonadaceae bacterium]